MQTGIRLTMIIKLHVLKFPPHLPGLHSFTSSIITSFSPSWSGWGHSQKAIRQAKIWGERCKRKEVERKGEEQVPLGWNSGERFIKASIRKPGYSSSLRIQLPQCCLLENLSFQGFLDLDFYIFQLLKHWSQRDSRQSEYNSSIHTSFIYSLIKFISVILVSATLPDGRDPGLLIYIVNIYWTHIC